MRTLGTTLKRAVTTRPSFQLRWARRPQGFGCPVRQRDSNLPQLKHVPLLLPAPRIHSPDRREMRRQHLYRSPDLEGVDVVPADPHRGGHSCHTHAADPVGNRTTPRRWPGWLCRTSDHRTRAYTARPIAPLKADLHPVISGARLTYRRPGGPDDRIYEIPSATTTKEALIESLRHSDMPSCPGTPPTPRIHRRIEASRRSRKSYRPHMRAQRSADGIQRGRPPWSRAAPDGRQDRERSASTAR